MAWYITNVFAGGLLHQRCSQVFPVWCKGFPACTDDVRARLSPICKSFTACFTSSSVNHEIKSESLNI